MTPHIYNMLPRKPWTPGILFMLGLVLLLSDGALFPWGNLAGLVCIGLVAWSER